jgi:hypothetical protein
MQNFQSVIAVILKDCKFLFGTSIHVAGKHCGRCTVTVPPGISCLKRIDAFSLCFSYNVSR